ncbi:hypothetical protein BDV11DRAFT_182248 [Aspergillus similis]
MENSWFLYSTQVVLLRVFPRCWWGSLCLSVGSGGFLTLYSEISRTPSAQGG